MRLPGTSADCGPLPELAWLSRQLHLGPPVAEGTDTVPVAQIVGSVQRGRDFDACWHPVQDRLAKILDEIQAAAPSSLDEPIDVIRVDRAYFVSDGHKRVALARRTGREFIDARVSHSATSFAVTPDLDEDAIFRTAREYEFRRHSGLAEALPDVRFALTDIDGYGELYSAVREHAFTMSERVGRIVPWPEVARDWYESDFIPTVAKAREHVGGLLSRSTDADVYLAINRQRLAWWGTECDDVECAAHQLMKERRLLSARSGGLSGLLRRSHSDDGPNAPLLPVADSDA
jgi:hypothetical protein